MRQRFVTSRVDPGNTRTAWVPGLRSRRAGQVTVAERVEVVEDCDDALPALQRGTGINLPKHWG